MRVLKYILSIILAVGIVVFYVLIQSAINYWGADVVHIPLVESGINAHAFATYIMVVTLINLALIAVIIAIDQTEDIKLMERSRKQYKQLS